MQPVVTGSAIVLEDEFVEVLAALIADVQQDGGIADKLFVTQYPDVSRTTRQVVRGSYTTYRSVYGNRTVAAVDNDGRLFHPPFGRDGVGIHSFTEHLQPLCEAFQIRYHFLTRKIMISRLD